MDVRDDPQILHRRIELMQRDLDAMHDCLVTCDLERALALLVMISDLVPEMPIAEAIKRVPTVRDLVTGKCAK